MLQRPAGQKPAFFCANPDIVVERGERLIWCAARWRATLRNGRAPLIGGTPHAPIYRRR